PFHVAGERAAIGITNPSSRRSPDEIILCYRWLYWVRAHLPRGIGRRGTDWTGVARCRDRVSGGSVPDAVVVWRGGAQPAGCGCRTAAAHGCGFGRRGKGGGLRPERLCHY